MSFGKASASPGLMTTQKAGALTQQIAKDERMARRVLDAKLAETEEEEGELRAPSPPKAPSPERVPVRPAPKNAAELEAQLLADGVLSRALQGRVNPGFFRPSAATYTSSAKRDFNDPRQRGEAVEPTDTTHFHSHDEVSAHAEATVRYAALLKGPAPKKET